MVSENQIFGWQNESLNKGVNSLKGAFPMKINHIALYTNDLERMKLFYETYFHAVSNQGYHNKTTDLRTYFLSFEDNTRLEIMARPNLIPLTLAPLNTGYIHLAFSVGSKDKVDILTNTLEKDGYIVFSKPRTTGDGYYESCVLDPDGNQIEIVE
jgi:lactoylglutathione lyase